MKRSNPTEACYYPTQFGYMLVDDEGNRQFFESEGALLAACPQAERMDP